MFIKSLSGSFETDPGDILRILGLDSLAGLDAFVAFENMVDAFQEKGDIASHIAYSSRLGDVYAYALKHEMGA